jgi:hypothetical protein
MDTSAYKFESKHQIGARIGFSPRCAHKVNEDQVFTGVIVGYVTDMDFRSYTLDGQTYHTPHMIVLADPDQLYRPDRVWKSTDLCTYFVTDDVRKHYPAHTVVAREHPPVPKPDFPGSGSSVLGAPADPW